MAEDKNMLQFSGNFEKIEQKNNKSPHYESEITAHNGKNYRIALWLKTIAHEQVAFYCIFHPEGNMFVGGGHAIKNSQLTKADYVGNFTNYSKGEFDMYLWDENDGSYRFEIRNKDEN